MNAMAQRHSSNMYPRDDWTQEWNAKSQPGMAGMMGARVQNSSAMQQQQPPASGWPNAQGWQGQLGPNLMPMTGSPEAQPMGGSRNMNNILPVAGAPRGPEMQRGGAPNMQNMQNMQNLMMGMQTSAYAAPNMPGGQRQDNMPNPQTAPMQPGPQMSNMQSPLMQVIALPVGAPPPKGAIPVGAPSAGMPEQMPQLQMIAVPMGEAPPEGAIPVGPGPAPAQPENAGPERAFKGFKIKDPRTGQEVTGPSDDTAAASRRMRIVNPKTGQEVRPNL